MKWLDSISNSVDMNLSKLQKIVKDRGAWHAAVHGVTKSGTRDLATEQYNKVLSKYIPCLLSTLEEAFLASLGQKREVLVSSLGRQKDSWKVFFF